MQYANVDKLRTAPAPRQKGNCPVCGNPMIAKCGSRVIWHWAHAGRVHCDPWWENETNWHRAWKSCFPEEQREIIRFDQSGEKHIADVVTSTGMIIEFQNSPMSLEELQSREQFYGNMIWIVNAQSFSNQFSLMSPVPDPNSELGRDTVFSHGQRPIKLLKPAPLAGLHFWLRSENVDHLGLVEIHSSNDFADAIFESYNGHHLFYWKKPRDVWLKATAPVFLDFGDEVLWHLQTYHDEYDVKVVRRILKSEHVAKYGGNITEIKPHAGETPIHPQVAPDQIRQLWLQ
jgi:competence protein CoiA